MKLSYEQIRAMTWGAVRVAEEDGGVAFHRFTEEEERLYAAMKPEHSEKALASSGIRLVFRTDSPTLKLAAEFLTGTSRVYYSLDVAVNGAVVGSLDNYSPMELIPNYTTVQLPLGEAEAVFDLGEGEKTVTVYLPWSVRTVLRELSVADGCFAEPVRPAKTLLVYGDSITQGYDAERPSCCYAALLANHLQAEEVNKAIGGEVFFPELARCDTGCSPDYVSVAYGTNDWGKVTEQEFEENCAAFYRILSEKYPAATIFAITPIWRKDIPDFPERRSFHLVADYIRRVTADLPNVRLIDGWDFVPKDESYFADLRLHPNDKGFAEYAKHLCEAIDAQMK